MLYLLKHPGGFEVPGILAAWRCDLLGHLTQLEEWDSAARIYLGASVLAEVRLPPPHSFQSLQAVRSLQRKTGRCL